MNSVSWLLLDSGRCNYALNMAIDEALLESMPRLDKPALRFYGWTEPAASFGYFQHFAEVRVWTPLRPLVRRPTAGGVVPHQADWTYAMAFPPSAEWYSVPAIESYRRVHAWIQAAFALIGVVTELAPAPQKAGAGQCFIGYEQYDLLWRGRKIAGAAQRRRRDGLLIQGSVQPPLANWDRAAWQDAMREAGRREYRIEWAEFRLDEPLRTRAEALARQKYGQAAYNEKR